ncbi:glycosyltransferase [Bradyrhizobium sp. SZCCHNRI2049]|uniref:glycosyltransferase n=1 Tax=Bradyrhizobium sp. SZCCHNRI2049 TaxID=3057287 RepID=UPI002916D702|nr:glycosyltransferase [Bradyrhizobium sp. SZCCHNRI2049]
MLAPSRRLSVLHIFNDYYPDLFGGAPSVIRDICAGLKNAFTACVLVCSKSNGQRRIVVNGVTIERVRSFGDVCSLPAAPTYPLRLWRQVADHDLLALHAPFPLADLMLALGLGRDRPLVVHYHADIASHAGLRWFVEQLLRRTLRRADAIIVSNAILLYNSPLLQEFAAKCHVVPFGVDASKYDWPEPRDNDAAERDRGRLVLACGQLVPYKGFDVLVRAAVGHRFEVWIIGEGPERARLERMIHSLGVADRVRLLGSAPKAKLASLMCTADVFVLPSLTNAETFGIAQLEAMAAGRPIINTWLDTAVPRVARHGIEAITVPPGNHVRLAEAIETLLRDPERRWRMGHAARLRATTQYSVDAFGKGIETVYRHAVTTKASSRSTLASRPGTIGTGPEKRHC